MIPPQRQSVFMYIVFAWLLISAPYSHAQGTVSLKDMIRLLKGNSGLGGSSTGQTRQLVSPSLSETTALQDVATTNPALVTDPGLSPDFVVSPAPTRTNVNTPTSTGGGFPSPIGFGPFPPSPSPLAPTSPGVSPSLLPPPTPPTLPTSPPPPTPPTPPPPTPPTPPTPPSNPGPPATLSAGGGAITTVGNIEVETSTSTNTVNNFNIQTSVGGVPPVTNVINQNAGSRGKGGGGGMSPIRPTPVLSPSFILPSPRPLVGGSPIPVRVPSPGSPGIVPARSPGSVVPLPSPAPLVGVSPRAGQALPSPSTQDYTYVYTDASSTVNPQPGQLRAVVGTGDGTVVTGAANALGASTAAVDPTALQPSASQLTLPSTFSIQSITVPHTAVSYVVPGTPSQLPMNVTFSFIYQNMGSSVKRPLAVVFNELGVNSNWYSTLAQSWAERGFAVAVFDFYKPLFLPTSVSQQVLGIPRQGCPQATTVTSAASLLSTLSTFLVSANTEQYPFVTNMRADEFVVFGHGFGASAVLLAMQGACAQPRKMLNSSIQLNTGEMSDVAVYYSCDVAPGLVATPVPVKIRGVIAYEPVLDLLPAAAFAVPPGSFVAMVDGQYSNSSRDAFRGLSGCRAWLKMKQANHYGPINFNQQTGALAAPCGAARAGQDSESFNVTRDQQSDNAKLLGAVSALLHRGVVMGDDAAQKELQTYVQGQQDTVLASSFIEEACFAA